MELEPVTLSLPGVLEQALALVGDRAARQQLTCHSTIVPEVGVV